MIDAPTPRGSCAIKLAILAVIAGAVLIVIVKHRLEKESQEGADVTASANSQLHTIADYTRHLKSHPDDTHARLDLGLLLKQTDTAAALDQLQRIPAGSAEFPEALRSIAHIFLVTGHDLEAAAALQPLAQQAPSDLGVRLSLAEIWYRQGKPDQALPHAQAALELMPERPETYLLVAEILDDLNRTFEMVPLLETAIEYDPSSWDAHLLLAYAAISSGQLDLAETAADWCLDHDPQSVYALRYRSMVLRARGDHDAALKEIRKATSLQPDDLECRLIEADLLLYQRDAQGAYDVLRPLYESSKDLREYLGALMRAALISGHQDEAHRIRNQLQTVIDEQENAR